MRKMKRNISQAVSLNAQRKCNCGEVFKENSTTDLHFKQNISGKHVHLDGYA